MFDIQQSIDTGGLNAACVVSLSGVSRQIILDALTMISVEYRWYPQPASNDAASAAIDSAIVEIMTNASIIPVGMITAYAAVASIPAVPHGWLVCNGVYVAVVDYPELAATIGNLYGTAPDGYVRLPDFRDRFLYGTEAGQISLASGGAASVTLSTANMPPHTHTMSTFATTTPSGAVSGTGRYITGTTSVNTGSAGGSGGAATAFNIIPPYTRVYFMIRAIP